MKGLKLLCPIEYLLASVAKPSLDVTAMSKLSMLGNVTSFMYHHYAFYRGEAKFADTECVLDRWHSHRWQGHLRGAFSWGCNFLWVNEGGLNREGQVWHPKAMGVLTKSFPDWAPWEFSS